jgi:DNA-binding CsgD family transcriptional regulator
MHAIHSARRTTIEGSVRPAPSRPLPPRSPEWRLTPRETEVLAAMAAGKTNAAIADVLCISRKAVEKHVNSIFSKLLLSGDQARHPRVQAVLIYLVRRPPDPDLSDSDPPARRAATRRMPHPGLAAAPPRPRSGHGGTAPDCRRRPITCRALPRQHAPDHPPEGDDPR